MKPLQKNILTLFIAFLAITAITTAMTLILFKL